MIESPAKIKDGKMSLQSREVFEAGVRALPDGDYTLKLEAVKASRTLQQLRGAVDGTYSQRTWIWGA